MCMHICSFYVICDNISVPKYVHICMHILMHVPYPCKHVHNKNVSIYAHLNIFIDHKYHLTHILHTQLNSSKFFSTVLKKLGLF